VRDTATDSDYGKKLLPKKSNKIEQAHHHITHLTGRLSENAKSYV